MTTRSPSTDRGRRRGIAGLVLLALCCATTVQAQTQPPIDAYRPDDFLTLDLNRAALSPRRLGPETHFAPFGVEARTETLPNTGGHTAHLARALAPQVDKNGKGEVSRTAEITPKPRGKPAVRRVATRRHGNPLDAQAFDARPQSWPCRGNSGICAWR
ncbi:MULTISPECIES: hypothetical protein [unclassified Bradyrhizobium]|uniref:hypothetical protein n=1 Tax=unclassified Bradyrhizobium TaxID=2631580 RepID=UPI0020125B48|nr:MULTISPECIES: hypothetical protein [unclassified Bradyrhizobium]